MDERAIDSTHLDTDECWRLLLRSGAGMLATGAAGRPDLFPINYLVDGHTLLFRTAPGTKVADLETVPYAAFGVQGREGDDHWSVVIRGRVEALTDRAEIIGSGVLELVSWGAGAKHVFFRLVPTSVQGRRVLASELARATLYG